MPRRSDSRSRMIHAAAELFRQRGYHATTFSDVVRDSGAPRGSTYFHIPGGKHELAREAIARAGDEVEAGADEAARPPAARGPPATRDSAPTSTACSRGGARRWLPASNRWASPPTAPRPSPT